MESITGKILPLKVKQEIHNTSIQNLQGPKQDNFTMQCKKVDDVLNKLSPEMMKQAQEEAIDISKAIHYVRPGKKPTLAHIHKIKSRYVYRYLNQFGWLVFWQRVLHKMY